jgi:hypothetical protein
MADTATPDPAASSPANQARHRYGFTGRRSHNRFCRFIGWSEEFDCAPRSTGNSQRFGRQREFDAAPGAAADGEIEYGSSRQEARSPEWYGG